MNKVTFLEGVAVALLAGLTGSIGYFMLQMALTDDAAVRGLSVLLTFAYLVYLLQRSNEKTGRITVMSLWFLLTLASGLTKLPLGGFVFGQILAIWLIRSLFYYASLVSAFADLAIGLFSLAAGLWAWQQSASVFLTVWCIFLTQALFAFIPSRKQPSSHGPDENCSRTQFSRAYQTAEAAIRKLSTLD